MVFVSELIPHEKRKEVHEWGIRNFGIDREAYRWTIDHAHDLMLLCFSRGRLGPGPTAERGQFALSYKGTPIGFEAQLDLISDEATRSEYVRFSVSKIVLPPSIGDRRDEVLGHIAEALKVYNARDTESRTEVLFGVGATP